MTRFRLPLIHSETLLSDGSQLEHLGVLCPRVSRIIDADRCTGCQYVRTISVASVECEPPVPVLPAGGDAPSASCSPVRVANAQEDVLVRRIFGTGSTTAAVPVVDDHGRFVGFVEAPQGSATGLPPRLARSLPAQSQLVGQALWIRDGTPLRRALHIMAARRSRILALVDDDGRLRGVLHDIDGLVAMRAGGCRPPQ